MESHLIFSVYTSICIQVKKASFLRENLYDILLNTKKSSYIPSPLPMLTMANCVDKAILQHF